LDAAQRVPGEPLSAPDLHDGAARGGRGVVARPHPAGAGRRRGPTATPSERRTLPRGTGDARRSPARLALRCPRGRRARRARSARCDEASATRLRDPSDPPATRSAGHVPAADLRPRRPRPGGAAATCGPRRTGTRLMNGFVVVGTDTDAGKTAFSLLFLTAFREHFIYWKPVETGESDTEKVRRLVPHATVFEPLARFREPVAPALAARREGRPMPGVADILAAVPERYYPLLIETFGSPLSPLTEDVLQVELIRRFGLPVVLVTSSAVGAIGRTLPAVRVLEESGAGLAAVVLVGPDDQDAV